MRTLTTTLGMTLGLLVLAGPAAAQQPPIVNPTPGCTATPAQLEANKKVALALQAMVRAQFPTDSIEMVGFYTLASKMTERQLLNSAPKPVGMFDPRIHLRISLDGPLPRQAQHFTNIDAGLKLARNMLAKQGATNKQIIVITDGEPTAHIEGREAVLIYPPAEKTAMATLAPATNLYP